MLLTILTILFSILFAKTAKAKGYPQRQIWLYPLIIGTVFTLISVLLSVAALRVFEHSESDLKKAYPTLAETVALIFYFMLIAKAWKQLKALPMKKQAKPTPQT